MKEITASEVRDRIEQWERREAPKLQAKIEGMLSKVYAEFERGFWKAWDDRELQQLERQRMTDDGCPLG